MRAARYERLGIGITIAPHALTSVTSLYIGIAGPDRQSTTPAGAPSGDFRTLSHLRSYGEHAHRLDITWTPTTYGRGTKVELALIYMVTINARQSLIEEMPVEFIVS
ncbi:MAG: hypothetical protein QOH56_190 [Pseudonocardiales bacterium]|jgi:hypothetical protein|nr:hypothetical protein [Pseudonocardiales bacterium]